MLEQHGINVHGEALNNLPNLHKQSFMVSIPNGHSKKKTCFKGICLVAAALIGVFHFKAKICKETHYIKKWDKLKNIHFPTKKGKFGRSCNFLKKELSFLKTKLPNILHPESQTPEKVLSTLANFYAVQYILRDSTTKDKIYFKTHEEILDTLPIINLHRECVDKNRNVYHVAVIKSLQEYKKKKSLNCFNCFKSHKSVDYFHKCIKKQCPNCRRFIPKGNEQKYPSMAKFFCYSFAQPQENVPKCKKCNISFRTHECKNAHKMTICRYVKKCGKCNALSTHGFHNCSLKYCKFCKSYKKYHLCPLNTKIKQKIWPKLCFLTFLAREPTHWKCYACYKSSPKKCEIHSKIKTENHYQMPNLAVTYREKKKRGLFERQEWNVEMPESNIKSFANYETIHNKYISNEICKIHPVSDNVPFVQFGKKPAPLKEPQELEFLPDDLLFERIIKTMVSDSSFNNTVVISHHPDFLCHVQEALRILGITPSPCYSKHQTITLLGIKQKNIVFISFQRYIKSSFYDLTKSYLNTSLNHCFPHNMNHPEYYNYESETLPKSDYFVLLTDTHDEKKAKENFCEQNQNQIWNFRNQASIYLTRKTYLLLMAVLAWFSSLFALQKVLKKRCNPNVGYLHPFCSPVCSLPSLAYALLRKHCLALHNIFVVKNSETGFPTYNCSKREREVGEFLAFKFPNHKIEGTYLNYRGQRLFPNKYSVDFYDPLLKKAYQFDGCYWHRHFVEPSCKYYKAKKKKLSPEQWSFFVNQRNQKKRYREEKINEIKDKWPDLLISHEEIHECSWLFKKKKSLHPKFSLPIQNTDTENTKELKLLHKFHTQFIDFQVMKRLIPRESVKGGLCNVYELMWKKENFQDEEILGVDFCSFYPFVAIIHNFPVGEYFVLMRNDCQNYLKLKNGEFFDDRYNQKVFGIALVSILPVQNCKHPIISYKAKDGSMHYTLCKTCSDKKIMICNHTEEERRFETTITLVELAYCLSNNQCQDPIFYEAYIYYKFEPVFKNFMNVMAREKLIHTGNPTSENTKYFLKTLNEQMNYQNTDLEIKESDLQIDKLKTQTHKLILNSCLGSLAQKSTYSKSVVCENLFDVHNVLKNNEVLDVSPFGPNFLNMFVETKSNFYTNNNANCILYAHILAYARIHLSLLIENLVQQNCNPLYADTDCVFFRKKIFSRINLNYGHAFGCLKPVIPGTGKDFFSLGTKSYHITYISENSYEMVICKLRGLALQNLLNPNTVNSDLFEDLLLAYTQNQKKHVKLDQIQTHHVEKKQRYTKFCLIELNNSFKHKYYIVDNERLSVLPLGFNATF